MMTQQRFPVFVPLPFGLGRFWRGRAVLSISLVTPVASTHDRPGAGPKCYIVTTTNVCRTCQMSLGDKNYLSLRTSSLQPGETGESPVYPRASLSISPGDQLRTRRTDFKCSDSQEGSFLTQQSACWVVTVRRQR
jgi:hypothetical protein